MATISLCMIVKNEENILGRCLDSLSGLMDEIIIVDTGSTDATKEVAKRYTDLIYDFKWQDDFAAARNFSFSKATMEYIYAPDADEVLDEENREAFARLKEALLPEIDIVQMKYKTVTEYNTVLNAATEYRPKLFKRLRTFLWEDPIHETIRLQPVVFDSDIVIRHMPQNLHSKRDFSVFEKLIQKQEILSDKLVKMYAMELMKTGDEEDLKNARSYFLNLYENSDNQEHREYGACVLAKDYRLSGQDYEFMKLALKDVAVEPVAEICYQLGQYYLDKGDAKEASLWFTNAAFETEPVLDIHQGGDLALQGLVDCYEQLLQGKCSSVEGEYYGDCLQQAKVALSRWKLPEE